MHTYVISIRNVSNEVIRIIGGASLRQKNAVAILDCYSQRTSAYTVLITPERLLRKFDFAHVCCVSVSNHNTFFRSVFAW